MSNELAANTTLSHEAISQFQKTLEMDPTLGVNISTMLESQTSRSRFLAEAPEALATTRRSENSCQAQF